MTLRAVLFLLLLAIATFVAIVKDSATRSEQQASRDAALTYILGN